MLREGIIHWSPEFRSFLVTSVRVNNSSISNMKFLFQKRKMGKEDEESLIIKEKRGAIISVKIRASKPGRAPTCHC